MTVPVTLFNLINNSLLIKNVIGISSALVYVSLPSLIVIYFQFYKQVFYNCCSTFYISEFHVMEYNWEGRFGRPKTDRTSLGDREVCPPLSLPTFDLTDTRTYFHN